MRTKHFLVALSAWLLINFAVCASEPAGARDGRLDRHTFFLEGGFFYGPGPIVPDTELPAGRLANIRFDSARLNGYCEFGNDGKPEGRLSDGTTRINQNIDAGRLLIGGGTSPILLTAVDGGVHKGTERYFLDAQYRFVWRVDIALDPGFPGGIIRLEDFELNTGVVRITPSLQTQRGEPGGYDQAGSLPAGSYLAGRVGDFNEDGYLDGILVAAPHVPLAADMLPGAPVGNRRGFRTDVPIAPNLSSELMLRGVSQLREALLTTINEKNKAAAGMLSDDLAERLRIVRSTSTRAADQNSWKSSGSRDRLLEKLRGLSDRANALTRLVVASRFESATRDAATQLFDAVAKATGELAALNAAGVRQLPHPAEDLAATH